MAQSFDFDLPDDTISPSTATPSSQRSPRKGSHRRWSTSTDGSKFDYDHKASTSWEAPPVPPIPPDQPSEAWRRRSLMRDSYTSQMSLRGSESDIRPHTATEHTDGRSSTLVSNAASAENLSSESTPRNTKRTSRLGLDVREKCQYDELHWTVSGLNPKAWPQRKKWAHTLAAGGVAFAILFSSSVVAPASTTIEDSFSTSPVVAVLSTSLYVLGLVFGSMIGTASSALVGRKVAQSCALLVSVAFTIASACVDSFAALHACRFFAGLFASPALWISLATLLEMWTTEKLAGPMIAFSALAMAGLTLGPVAGSYIIESQNVRWTQYTIVIAKAVALALVLAMRETHKETVQRRRREARHARPSLQELGRSSIIGPCVALLKMPTLLLLSIYAGAILGTFYAAFTAFPSVFALTFDFSLGQQGLTFIAMLVGILLGATLLILNHTFIYRPRVAQWRKHYDAEVERALAEEKHLKRRSRRNSRTSSKLPKRKSTISLFSSSANQGGSRLSLIQAFTRHDSRPDLMSTQIDFEDRNVALSVAAAEYLNSVNEKRILPERVLLILSRQPAFGELCEQLESYGLRVDRVKLAQVFLDALQRQQADTRPVTAAATETAQGQAEEHATLAAAMETAQPPSRPALKKSHSTMTLLSHTSPTFKAPPVWRLWPALPASVLGAGGLFLFAWTATGSIHWIAAAIGMGLLTAGGSVTLVSMLLYALEKFGEDAVAGGSMVAWLLAAMFPVFSVPLFRALTTGIAGSVLGAVSLCCCVPMWVVVLKGGRR